MNRFNQYQKISESTENWQLDTKDARQLQRIDWCVTEKIHGANFCWIVNKTEVLCAKRKALLAPTDEFFNYQIVKEKLSPNIKQVFNEVLALKPELIKVYIYGELFGGLYPHPDVPPDYSVKPIQTGIYYSPSIEFCGFDIAADTGECFEYLDYYIAIDIFERSSLLYAKPLFVGKMQGAFDYPIRFASVIPRLLNLPPLKAANFAEGIVIKPIQSIEVQGSKGLIRPIIKKKIAEFLEDTRYHQAENWNEKSELKSFGDYILDELEWDISMIVNQNRLNNAISKVGFINENTLNEIRKVLREDVQAELRNKYGNRLLKLTSEDHELVESVLKDHIDEILAKNI